MTKEEIRNFVRGIAEEMQKQGDPVFFTELEVVRLLNIAFKKQPAANFFTREQMRDAIIAAAKKLDVSEDGVLFELGTGREYAAEWLFPTTSPATPS